MKGCPYILFFLFVFNINYGINTKLFIENESDTVTKQFYKLTEKGKLYEANKLLDDKIKANSALDNKNKLGVLYNLKGEFLLNINNLDSALKSFISAENYCRDTNDYLNLAHTKTNIGNYHFLKKEYFIAINNYNTAIIHYNKSNRKEFIPEIIVKKLKTYLALERYKKARVAIENHRNHIVKNASEEVISEFYYLIATLEYKSNNIKEAVKYANKSKAIGNQNRVSNVLISNLKLLSDIYKEKSKFKLSNKYAEQRQHLLDSIYSLESGFNENLISAKAIKDFNDSVNSDLLSKQKKLQKGNPFGKNTSLVFLFLLAILLIPIGFLIYINRQNKKYNAILEKKNIELIVANKNSKEAIKTRDTFLSTVTHELRTPLYSVIGLTEILLNNNPKKNQIKHLNSLKHSGDHLLNFINKILHFNKIESSEIQINNSNFNLKTVIENIVNTLNVSSNKNNNIINVNFNSNLSEIVYGDKIKISQIVLNLIGNSLKFTKEGVIEISVFNIKKSKLSNTIGIQVADNGIGISDEKQNEVFKSFKQVNSKDEITSTGLGLPIVKSLVNLLNGKITMKSKLNQGTTITIELPFKINQTLKQPIKESSVTLTPNILENIKILIVDDNLINQTITTKILKSINLKSDAVNDGRTAIEKILNNYYDIVLMDINMPRMNGYEATERIRTFNSNICIFALTAISKDDEDNHFMKKGFDGFISKPFDIKEFKNIMYSKIESIISREKIEQID